MEGVFRHAQKASTRRHKASRSNEKEEVLIRVGGQPVPAFFGQASG